MSLQNLHESSHFLHRDLPVGRFPAGFEGGKGHESSQGDGCQTADAAQRSHTKSDQLDTVFFGKRYEAEDTQIVLDRFGARYDFYSACALWDFAGIVHLMPVYKVNCLWL